MKEIADTYGVLVRAGAVTPQADDELFVRGLMGMPSPSAAVADAWREEGGIRRPITLRQEDEETQGKEDAQSAAAPSGA
ncbi:hypothetical protein ACTSKR_07640 [Chitinibacteraceae bacterium HSL-7]